MSYTRLTWVESETPLSAQNMNNIEDGIEELQAQKVDKVSGKALSDNNYTTAEKTKLAEIEAGAEVNVQSDWDQSDSTADDFIKNKPGNASTSTAGFMSASDKSKLDGVQAGAQVNPDDFEGATASAAGVHGLVPAPTSTDFLTKKLLVADGNWRDLTFRDTNSNGILQSIGVANDSLAFNLRDAATTRSGLMSAADKTKLGGIEAGSFVVKKATATEGSINVYAGGTRTGTFSAPSGGTLLGVTGWEISGNSSVFLKEAFVNRNNVIQYELKNPTSSDVTNLQLTIHYIYHT